jgi:hypothetical protein
MGGAKIAGLPKIKIEFSPGLPELDAIDIEQTRTQLDFRNGIFMLDGQRIRSYEDLVELASQEKYKDKEFIKVQAVLLVAGG